MKQTSPRTLISLIAAIVVVIALCDVFIAAVWLGLMFLIKAIVFGAGA